MYHFLSELSLLGGVGRHRSRVELKGERRAYELHTIVWNQVQQRVGFHVIYLDQAGVSLQGNGIELPGGTVGTSGSFAGATWSLSR